MGDAGLDGIEEWNIGNLILLTLSMKCFLNIQLRMSSR